MKKKCVLIFFAVAVILMIVGLGINKEDDRVYADDIESKMSFSKQGIMKDFGAGWKYSFEILHYENGLRYYTFDGYDLKHTYVDGYYIKVVDSETGKVVSKTISEVPTLSRSDRYGNDIVKINNYFNEKQFTDFIGMEDLTDLDIKEFDKQTVLEMFNEAINSKVSTIPGKYINEPIIEKTTIESTDPNMVGNWTLTYFNDYGYLTNVLIEFKFKDGTYLSETKGENNDLRILEQAIVDNQCIYCSSTLNKIVGMSKYRSTDLTTLLLEAND